MPRRLRFLLRRCFPESEELQHRASVATSDKVQDEDVAICESVQRGLASRAYGAGRLSVRREAGEHLFHRLLAVIAMILKSLPIQKLKLPRRRLLPKPPLKPRLKRKRRLCLPMLKKLRRMLNLSRGCCRI
jgi:hypothetical protein